MFVNLQISFIVFCIAKVYVTVRATTVQPKPFFFLIKIFSVHPALLSLLNILFFSMEVPPTYTQS